MVYFYSNVYIVCENMLEFNNIGTHFNVHCLKLCQTNWHKTHISIFLKAVYIYIYIGQLIFYMQKYSLWSFEFWKFSHIVCVICTKTVKTEFDKFFHDQSKLISTFVNMILFSPVLEKYKKIFLLDCPQKFYYTNQHSHQVSSIIPQKGFEKQTSILVYPLPALPHVSFKIYTKLIIVYYLLSIILTRPSITICAYYTPFSTFVHLGIHLRFINVYVFEIRRRTQKLFSFH